MSAIACRNRVTPHLDSPANAPPKLSSDPAARTAALADAVFASLIALQAQLAHPDAAVVREAAGLILDFEKTRLRHDRPVSGTQEPYPPFAPTCGSDAPNPAPTGRDEDEDDETEPDEDDVQRVREHLQQLADEQGTGESVSWDRAYRVAKRSLDRARLRQTVSPPV